MIVYVVKEGDHARLVTLCLGSGYSKLDAWKAVHYQMALEGVIFAWGQTATGRVAFSRYSTEAYLEAEVL